MKRKVNLPSLTLFPAIFSSFFSSSVIVSFSYLTEKSLKSYVLEMFKLFSFASFFCYILSLFPPLHLFFFPSSLCYLLRFPPLPRPPFSPSTSFFSFSLSPLPSTRFPLLPLLFLVLLLRHSLHGGILLRPSGERISSLCFPPPPPYPLILPHKPYPILKRIMKFLPQPSTCHLIRKNRSGFRIFSLSFP